MPGGRGRRVVAVDGDGKSDVIWRNDASGETAVWVMDGRALIAGAGLLNDPNWQLTHIGDFNGDGKSDLIWRNSGTGQTAMWLMNGTMIVGGYGLVGNGRRRALAVGHFN